MFFDIHLSLLRLRILSNPNLCFCSNLDKTCCLTFQRCFCNFSSQSSQILASHSPLTYIRFANLVFNPIFLHKKQIPLVAMIQLPQSPKQNLVSNISAILQSSKLPSIIYKNWPKFPCDNRTIVVSIIPFQ